MNISDLTAEQRETRRRIIELSYQSKLSHIGSCLSCIDIIDAVYRVKSKEERFVLSGGHAAIALYVILEKNNIIDSSVIKELHIHPDRNIDFGIDVSRVCQLRWEWRWQTEKNEFFALYLTVNVQKAVFGSLSRLYMKIM
jgi:hypothetical protein